jgi:type III secretory pathway component EscU
MGESRSEMPEDEVTPESVLELREEVLQRVEAVERRSKRISVLTMVVAFGLLLGFVYQIVLPFTGGSAVQTVSLTDPALVTVELVLSALALAWLLIALSDYRFAARLSNSIRKVRSREKEIERELSGPASSG